MVRFVVWAGVGGLVKAIGTWDPPRGNLLVAG